MSARLSEKKKAVELRKLGKTYSEILQEVPVAKSTLSLWLRDVGLARKQRQRITEKRIAAQMRGAERRREQRIEKTRALFEEARKDVRSISKRELWLIGVILYWAEGAKEKEHNTGVGIDFCNSDPRMIKLFLRWLEEIAKIDRNRISLSLYIHKTSRNRVDEVIEYWAKQTGYSRNFFNYVYFKKHNPKTRRKNTGENYFGLLDVRVRASSDLNRKIAGWVEEINRKVWGVV